MKTDDIIYSGISVISIILIIMTFSMNVNNNLPIIEINENNMLTGYAVIGEEYTDVPGFRLDYSITNDCDEGACSEGYYCSENQWIDQDTADSLCDTCGNTWLPGIPSNSNGNCCGDDNSDDIFYLIDSASQSGEEVICQKCNQGQLEEITLRGNGYLQDNVCFYGDVKCNDELQSDGGNCILSGNQICGDNISCYDCELEGYTKLDDYTCNFECTDDDDSVCAGGRVCEGTSCVDQLLDGESCNENSDCLGGLCKTGVCRSLNRISVEENNNISLNEGETCETNLIYLSVIKEKDITITIGGYTFVEEDATVIELGNDEGEILYELFVDYSDSDEQGRFLVELYREFKGYEMKYEFRFDDNDNGLYLQQPEPECPLWCGDGECDDFEKEFVEDSYDLNCTADCNVKEGKYLEPDNFLVINPGQKCNGIFKYEGIQNDKYRFREYKRDGSEKIIYVEDKNSDVNEHGSLLILPHGTEDRVITENKLRVENGDTQIYVEDINNSCEIDCENNDRECINGSGYKVCLVNEESNFYGIWNIDTFSCSSFKKCYDGESRTKCDQECSSIGKQECVDEDNSTMVKTCGQFDYDWCYEWGPQSNYTDCGEYYKCDDGKCELDCDNDCDYEGQFICAGTDSYGLCKNLDDDPCYELTDQKSCASGVTCSHGYCGECTENWNCGEWSECVANKQTRECTDLNKCQSTDNRPSISQSCEPKCSTTWVCNDWGECQSTGIRERSCEDVGTCAIGNKIETQNCVYTPPVIAPPPAPVDPFIEDEFGDEEEGTGIFGSGFMTILIILFALIFLGGLSYVGYELAIAKKNLFGEKGKENFSEKTKANLHNFIHNNIAYHGHHPEALRSQFHDEGWNRSAINRTFSQIPNQKITQSLLNHIHTLKKDGLTDDKIKNILIRKGWDNNIIANVLTAANKEISVGSKGKSNNPSRVKVPLNKIAPVKKQTPKKPADRLKDAFSDKK